LPRAGFPINAWKIRRTIFDWRNPIARALRNPHEERKAEADHIPPAFGSSGQKNNSSIRPTLYWEGTQMKKALSILGVATLFLCIFSLAGAARPETPTWTGWISDSGCGAKGMSTDHKGCALKCVHEKGAKFVFVNSESKQVFNIHNQDSVQDSDVGMQVQLSGHLMEDNSIHVDSITPTVAK
jgi:hypothetical protein